MPYNWEHPPPPPLWKRFWFQALLVTAIGLAWAIMIGSDWVWLP